MEIIDLSTPALLIDWDQVEANCRMMSTRARSLGVRLRPHVKTHKCVEIARLQVAGHFGGITVSTMAEARTFAAHGFDDITLAVPLAPHRVEEAVGLGLNILIDSLAALEAIEAAVTQPVCVFLKVDCGYGRAGVLPDDPEAWALAERLHRSQSINFRGILTHGGQSYDCVNADEILQVARQERDAVVGFSEHLRSMGIPCPEVSVGSTPTMMHVDHLEGVTEMRPGNYALFDGFQSAIGSCRPEHVAVSVMGSVIAAHPDRAILDLGALAMSKDPGPVHVDAACGFGRVLSLDGVPLDDVALVGLSQEHGKLRGSGIGALSVGQRVRVVPNHSCLTMACFERAHTTSGSAVTGSITPCRGW